MTQCKSHTYNSVKWHVHKKTDWAGNRDHRNSLAGLGIMLFVLLFSLCVQYYSLMWDCTVDGTVAMCIASHKALVHSASRAVCAMPVALTCTTPCPISTTQLYRSASCRAAIIWLVVLSDQHHATSTLAVVVGHGPVTKYWTDQWIRARGQGIYGKTYDAYIDSLRGHCFEH